VVNKGLLLSPLLELLIDAKEVVLCSPLLLLPTKTSELCLGNIELLARLAAFFEIRT